MRQLYLFIDAANYIKQVRVECNRAVGAFIPVGEAPSLPPSLNLPLFIIISSEFLPCDAASSTDRRGTHFWFAFRLDLGGIPTSIVKVGVPPPPPPPAPPAFPFTSIKTFSALTHVVQPGHLTSASTLACLTACCV